MFENKSKFLTNTNQPIYAVVFTVCVMLFSSGAFAQDILKNVSYTTKGQMVEITAELDVPFSYVKHFPRKRGKIIQIQIKANAEGKQLKRREMIQPKKDAPLPIRDIIYEGNVRGGPYLVLRFKRVVEFSVKPNNDSSKIRIFVKFDDEEEVKAVEKKVEGSESNASKIMKDARFALTNGKNADAILLFSQLLEMKDHEFVADAKEYLGLARERNGQLEMAKAQYEEYIRLYPKERRTNTVKQRLMTLNARLAAPKRNLKESKRQKALRNPDQKRVDIFGRVSQSYYHGSIQTEQNSRRDQQNTILSFLDATRRERGQSKETRLVFSGSHETDLLNDGHMEARVRSIYGEYKGKKNGLELSFGRQTENSGGVLGRFDGGVLGFRLKPKIRAYGVAGFPVDFVNHHDIQDNKPMVGGRLEFDELIPHWKMSAYGIRQQADGIINRAAIGGDVRFFFNKKIFYSLVDYDASYGVMNFLTLHYGWQMTQKTKFDIHIDQRRSPVMLTTNALQGLSVQKDETGKVFLNFDGHEDRNLDLPVGTVLSIKKLKELGISEKEIRDRAINNTGSSTLITLNARHAFDKELTMNSYLTLSKYVAGKNLTKDEDEDDVPEDTSFLSSGFDVSLSAQIIKNNFYKPRGILIGGARVSNNRNSNRYEANATFRTPLKKKWWTDYKMRVMYTSNKTEDKDSARLSPRFKLDYKHTRKLSFDTSLGVDFNKSSFIGQDYSLFLFNAGFRYLF